MYDQFKSQTYNGATGAIPDTSHGPLYLNVKFSKFRFEIIVCIDITHTWVSDLIELESPVELL